MHITDKTQTLLFSLTALLLVLVCVSAIVFLTLGILDRDAVLKQRFYTSDSYCQDEFETMWESMSKSGQLNEKSRKTAKAHMIKILDARSNNQTDNKLSVTNMSIVDEAAYTKALEDSSNRLVYEYDRLLIARQEYLNFVNKKLNRFVLSVFKVTPYEEIFLQTKEITLK